MENKEIMLDEIQYDAVSNYPMVKIEEKVLDFDLEIYDPVKDEVINKKISDFKWNWLVLMFYPADFTFVCPTELKDLNNHYKEINDLWDVQVLWASTDTVFSHRGWIENEKLLEWFQIPLISDRRTILSRYFGILNESTWNSERWSFVISPEWVLKSIEIITEPVGRSAKELIRRLKALKFTTENTGSACPANWIDDAPVLKPSIKKAWHIGDDFKVRE